MENNIWVEKYRPDSFEGIVGQDEIITAIQSRLNNLPHMIFEGKAGTGKTTTAHVISQTLNTDFLELNSSEERGIDTVRGKIMSFAKHLSFNKAPYKILFLDEADSMTGEAQLALRPLMEKHAHNCRFIIGCNFIDKIINPIKSRCKTYRFKPVDKDNVIRRLRYVAERENVFVSMSEQDIDNALDDLADRSHGDLRKAINDLQMNDYGGSEISKVFQVEL